MEARRAEEPNGIRTPIERVGADRDAPGPNAKKPLTRERLFQEILVPRAGIEPARLAAGDFESPNSGFYRSSSDNCLFVSY